MASNLVVLAIHGDAIDAIGTIALSRDNGVVTCTSTWKLVGRTVRVKTAGRSTCPKRGTHRYRVRRGGVVSVAR
jgi:hypothetical protein